MQDYIDLRINANPCNETVTDLVASYLCDIGYESFTSDDSGMNAFIQSDLFNEDSLKDIFADFPIVTDFSYSYTLVKGEDWNEEWEKNYFQPIVIENRCVVHSSFHHDVPEADFHILIDPKMAFGTGHHSTTSQMMKLILSYNPSGKTITDMGTGTGILAILCKMLGASDVAAIEIDPFACENAVENAKLNDVDINIVCGDASKLSDLRKCDLFLANINRNIITGDIREYACNLKAGGEMFLSGFYYNDIPVIMKEAEPLGLNLVESISENDWTAVRLVKKSL